MLKWFWLKNLFSKKFELSDLDRKIYSYLKEKGKQDAMETAQKFFKHLRDGYNFSVYESIGKMIRLGLLIKSDHKDPMKRGFLIEVNVEKQL